MNSDGTIAEETKYNNTLGEAEIFAYSIVKKYGKCIALLQQICLRTNVSKLWSLSSKPLNMDDVSVWKIIRENNLKLKIFSSLLRINMNVNNVTATASNTYPKLIRAWEK